MSKISELSDGGSLQSTDYLIAVRSGGNVKVRPNGAVSGTTGQFSTSLNVDGTVTADGLTIGDSSSAFSLAVIQSSTSGESELRMGDTDTDAGSIAYTNSDDTMTFRAAAAARMALDSTGLDVTGTVTADGLAVDGSQTIQSSSGGILTLKSTNTSADTNTILGQINFYNSDASGSSPNNAVIIKSTGQSGGGNGDLFFNVTNSGVEGGDPLPSMYIADTGDISFYEDTGTTPKFFWDASAEAFSLGGEGTLPASIGGAAGVTRTGYNPSGAVIGRTFIGDGTGYSFHFSKRISSTTTDLVTIKDNGNVGIGTSSPAGITAGITTLAISDAGAKTTGDKAGALSFITDDTSFTGTYSDGVTTEISSISESSTGASYGLAFATSTTGGAGRAERMRIDASGDVGIGTDSPGGKLSVRGTSGLGISDSHLAFGANQDAYITTGASGIVVFREHDGVSTNTERMRIDANGNLLVGTTSITTDPGIQLFGSGSIYTHIAGTSSADSMRFYRNNAQVGAIVTTGTTTAYNTSSDARLKENIADAESASERIDAIQVRQFDWKADGSHQDYGMIAQELLEVAPEAVSGDPESDDMMGVDYSKLVPMLVKEIQSLRARVAQLEGA